jgi:hypothetical protein
MNVRNSITINSCLVLLVLILANTLLAGCSPKAAASGDASSSGGSGGMAKNSDAQLKAIDANTTMPPKAKEEAKANLQSGNGFAAYMNKNKPKN